MNNFNYKELVEILKRRGLGNGSTLGHHSGIMDEAADAIEALIAERDALFEQVRGYCHTCKHNHTDFDCNAKCYGHRRGTAWEWDGGKEADRE